MTATHRPRPKPATADHLKKKTKPTQDVYICLEPELETTKNELEAAKDAIDMRKSQAEFELTVAEELPDGDPTKEQLVKLRTKRVADVTAELEVATEALEKAEDEVAEKTVYLRLQGIGRKKYDKLREEHPPTDAQVLEFQKDNPKEDGTPGIDVPEYNGDTYPPALISKCLVAPKLTASEVEDFTEDWNFNEYLQLFMAAVTVNTITQVRSWGKASG